MKTLITLLTIGALALPNIKMPDLRNFNLTMTAEIYCYDDNKARLNWYQKGNQKALTFSRIGKKPFAIVFDGFVYLDNGSSGFAEDGYIDTKYRADQNMFRAICSDYPKETKI